MTTLLRLDASALGEQAHSSQLADTFTHHWQAKNPHGQVINHLLVNEVQGHLDDLCLSSMFTQTPPSCKVTQAKFAQADVYLAELKAADHVVIATPMYNFGIPSYLKTWFDFVMRAGETFRYTETGPEGLLKGKKATLIITSGGDYTQDLAFLDCVTPHLKAMLGFMGIQVAQVINAPGLNMGQEEAAMSAAKAAITAA
jgi:FMN-dependent NADH-azoreductase